MLNLIESDVTKVKYKDEAGIEHEFAIIPVITLPNHVLSELEGKERRKERRWERFYKSVHKELEVIEDVELYKENDVFEDYEDDQYAFVDYMSLASLNERQRGSYSVGLRYAEETEEFKFQARQFSEDFIKKMDISENMDINKDIPFEYIEATRDDIAQLLKTISRENERRLIEHASDEKREKNKSAYAEDESKEELSEEIKSIDSAEMENYAEKTSVEEEVEKTYEQDDMQVDETITEELVDDSGELSEIEELQNDLYNTIDNLIPKVYLENFQENEQLLDKELQGDSTFLELEKLTQSHIDNNKQRTIERLNKERQSIIDLLYRKASSKLYQKYAEDEKLFNFESPESDYHQEYKRIKQKFDQIQASAESQREDKFVELTRKFESDMERRAKQAYELEKAKIEREERPNVEKEANKYKEDLLENSKSIYDNQIDNLLNDINITFESRTRGIIDSVLDEFQGEIDSKINIVKEDIETSTDRYMEMYQKEVTELRKQVKELKHEQLQNEDEFQRRVALEVNKLTQSIREENKDIKKDKASMEDEINRLKRQIKQNESYIDNLQHENKQKEDRLRISENELKNYKSHLLSNYTNDSIDIEREAQKTNFNKVVAPKTNKPMLGEGNRKNVVATEKVVLPFKKKMSNPLMVTLCAVTIGSAGLFGLSSHEDSKANEKSKLINEDIEKFESFKKNNDAKNLKEGTTLTIRADNRLKPATVIGEEKGIIKVKTDDGKEYPLSK
ncbi:TPA: hypothetical protein PEE30_002655 [Staphylococcus aureus]|nr:hypothetical protein [Staphylococcus aureus]